MEIRCLSNLLPALSCAKKIDRDPKVSESPRKIDSIHQNDGIVATRACAVATKKWRTGPQTEFLSPRLKTSRLLTLVEYSLVSDGTTAGSANGSNLGATPSGPPALLVFKALNFLDIDSSEIEVVEIVCVMQCRIISCFYWWTDGTSWKASSFYCL